MIRIVTGGQTGVDRGALDAALEAGIDCGGWCPAGRRAEDGMIPDRYPLRELPSRHYGDRTLKNVEDSDATLVICYPCQSDGTRLTGDLAAALGKPCLEIQAADQASEQALDQLLPWYTEHEIGVLNVAGPRKSEWEGGEAYAQALVRLLISSQSKPESS